MGRKSTKPNKSLYQLRREELGLSREAASKRLQFISPDRIEKIENEKSKPHPDEILQMSEGYQMPELCNHYCANECSIGKKYVPEIQIKELSQIIFQMDRSLRRMNEKQDRLADIAVNGKIEKNEVRDFVHIQEELEQISIGVETLQLWVEQMLANKSKDVLDIEEYNYYKKI